jgi:tetratricopeptide (TPR) repeat protein
MSRSAVGIRSRLHAFLVDAVPRSFAEAKDPWRVTLLNLGIVFVFAVVLACLCLPAAAQPSSPPNASPRAAIHDGYGRMVFDWDGPVSYSADVINGQLVVRFDRPVKGDFHNLVRPLSKYLGGVSVSTDRTTATFPLLRPVQVKAATGSNGSVVVDLVDAGEPSAAAGPMSLLPSASVPASPAGPAQPPAVDVRAGEHGSYNRLVFEWPRTVDYKVEVQGSRATITFASPGRLAVAALQAALPSDMSVQSADVGVKSTTLVLGVPQGARLRHFQSGAKVVVDVVRAAGSEGPGGTVLGPLAPPPGSDVTLPALKPLVQEAAPSLPSESLPPPPSGPSPVKPTTIRKPDTAARPSPPAAAPPARAAEEARTAAEPAQTHPDNGKTFSLSVAWDKPVAAAVFRRAGYLWLVFDRRQEVDTRLVRRLGGEAVTQVEQIANREATVLRLVVQPEYSPSVRRDGLMWVIDLIQRESRPKEPIAITAPAVLPTGTGIVMAVPEAGSVISVADPEVGDEMLVVPVIPLGAGVYPGRNAPDLELLPTTQGVAVVPHVDGLQVTSSRSGITIGRVGGGGLRLSTNIAQQTPSAKTAAEGAFFDIGLWKRSGPDNFTEEQSIVEAGLIDLPPARRSAAHIEAARFYFANGYAAEALGFLRMAADEDTSLPDTGAFRALRGAAEVLMGQCDLAVADFDNPAAIGDAESRMWRAAAHVAGGDNPAGQDKAMAAGLIALKDYPKPLAAPLAAFAAEAAIAAGDDEAAQAALTVLDRMTLSSLEDDHLNYLHGAYEEMVGRFPRALDYYDRAARGDNREFHARAALAATELQLKLGKIKVDEAIRQLDGLRFAWREEAFEFALLKRLGELQIQAADYPDALRSLRSLVNNFPDDKNAAVVSKLMTDTFARLYFDGAADTMSPISAIGLYDEFRDLTPIGSKGDEMIRKLADRLVSVDLLDRAAELLKHQVTYRLQGLDKARVGAQLALLDLLNKQPQGALDALLASDMDGLPPDLFRQRRHWKARALADLNRVPEAIAQLSGDDSPEATQLRAEIYWNKSDWPDAAATFETMLPRPERGAALDDASARLVLSWATALVLGNDERGLASLRRSFGPAMLGTPYKDGFTLLTSAVDRDIPNMPAVASKIKEAEGFQTFMSDYKKRLKAGGLSAIN